MVDRAGVNIVPNRETPATPTLSQTTATVELQEWAKDLITTFRSTASNQFILHGNVNDRMMLAVDGKCKLGNLDDFLYEQLLKRFDIVLSYDLGKGLVVVRESTPDIFSFPDTKIGEMPRMPKPAVELVSLYVRSRYNLSQLSATAPRFKIAMIIKSANLVCPLVPNNINYDLSSLALSIRDWTIDTAMLGGSFISFVIAENLSDLHPVIANNSRAKRIEIPLPKKDELKAILDLHKDEVALGGYKEKTDELAGGLVGVMAGTLESMLKTKNYRNEAIAAKDLVAIKKQMVERDSNGLLTFMQSDRTLDDFNNNEGVRHWIRKDLEMWNKGKLNAVPMGYLFAAPVGCGKNFVVECIAGEAGIPVVMIGNFRDKYVGTTEANVERIFRLIDALGRVIVFIDEADQTMGKRDSGSSDGGLSGRVYSMFATKMSNPMNRGRILWIMASSRPDLIELDLKRPGRIDVKIPLFPTGTKEESFNLLRQVCKKNGIIIPETAVELKDIMPLLLTPGGATTLAAKVYRAIETDGLEPVTAVKDALRGYQNPIPLESLEFQIGLAMREASDKDFIPKYFQEKYGEKKNA
jgi:ATP-dependent 26S proteasome regulatory subunit